MRKSKKPTAVITAVLTLLTIMSWAGFEIYRSFTTKGAPPVPAAIINPLDPTLDTQSLDTLESRPFLDENQIGNSQVSPEIIPSTAPVETSPLPTTTPVASASATASATPTVLPTSTP